MAEYVELGYASTVHGVQGDTADAGHLVLGEHTGASSAYVGMTRGRAGNVAHLVAADLAEARAQWVATFGRDRADLGPAHAAQLAAEAAANYAEARPVAQVLDDLHDAWTSEQDALDRLGRLEPRVDALRQIVALRAEQATELLALKDAHQQARETTDQTTARSERSAGTVARDADRLRDALLADWDTQRNAATQAAQTVTAGTGRFGKHRAAVTDAKDRLAEWSASWRPYLPAMPAEPAAVVRYATRVDHPPVVWEAFEHWAQHRSAQMHPEHATALTAAEDARTQEHETSTAYQEAAEHHNRQLWFHGPLARTPDPTGRLAEAQDSLTDTRDRLDHARHDIASVIREPALAGQTDVRLTVERDQWQRNRDTTKLAAAAQAEAAARAARRRDALSHVHDQPQFSPTPHQGPSIGH